MPSNFVLNLLNRQEQMHFFSSTEWSHLGLKENFVTQLKIRDK